MKLFHKHSEQAFLEIQSESQTIQEKVQELFNRFDLCASHYSHEKSKIACAQNAQIFEEISELTLILSKNLYVDWTK